MLSIIFLYTLLGTKLNLLGFYTVTSMSHEFDTENKDEGLAHNKLQDAMVRFSLLPSHFGKLVK